MKREGLAHAIVWAGARACHDYVLDQIGTADLRRAPLAVLLQGEARELLKRRLTPNQVTAALAAGGTHPYVLKVIAHALLSRSGDPGNAIQLRQSVWSRSSILPCSPPAAGRAGSSSVSCAGGTTHSSAGSGRGPRIFYH